MPRLPEKKGAVKFVALAFVAVIAVIFITPFVLPLYTGGWEIGVGIDHVDYKTVNTDMTFQGFGATGVLCDPDGLPYFPPYPYSPAAGEEPSMSVRTSNGFRKVTTTGATTDLPVQIIGEGGTIQRDGIYYIYDLYLYEFQIDVITTTTGKSVKVGGDWAEEVGTLIQFTVAVNIEIDPWEHREGGLFGGGIMSAYLAPYIIPEGVVSSGIIPDTNPWEGIVSGADEGPFYDLSPTVNAFSFVNLAYIDEAEVTGDWAQVRPDDSIPTQIQVSVSGEMRAGAQYQITFPWGITDVAEVDVECYWNIVVEVMTVHGWDPESGVPKPAWVETVVPPQPYPDIRELIAGAIAALLDFLNNVGKALLDPATFFVFIVALVVIIIVLVVLYIPGAGRGLKGMFGKKGKGGKK